MAGSSTLVRTAAFQVAETGSSPVPATITVVHISHEGSQEIGMPNIAGVDGCKAGWFCVFEELPSRQIGSKIFPTINYLATYIEQVDIVAIDIPIGLTDAGPRECDAAARKMLGGKRASSVFPAPIRSALYADSYEEACEQSFEAQQKKLSKQAWAIYPKIRELDELLRRRPDLRDRVFEVHPEVCFCAWNKMKPLVEPKKTTAGAAKRRALIDAHFGAAAYDAIRVRYPRKDVADDDISDAFAALWTAERILQRESRSLPENPQTDTAGLPIRMVY